MNDGLRMRDVYAEYHRGRISFERVISAADERLERYALVRQQRNQQPESSTQQEAE